MANALQDNYDKYVAVNGAGRSAQRVADANRSAFIRLAEKAGYAAGEARRLADRLLNIPRSRTTQIEARTAEAQARLARLKSLYDALRSKSITVTTYVAQVRRNKVENQLDRYGGAYASDQAFSLAPSDAGTFRSTPPTQVDVASNITVNLDGAPFRNMTVRAIEANNRREKWRAKVGPR